MKFNKAGNAIKSLVYRIAGSQYQDFVAVAFCWNNILGNLLSERTKLIKIENQTLFVAVSNNIWMQELLLNKQELLEKIRKSSGVKLENIVFFLEDDSKERKPNYLKRKRKHG